MAGLIESEITPDHVVDLQGKLLAELGFMVKRCSIFRRKLNLNLATWPPPLAGSAGFEDETSPGLP